MENYNRSENSGVSGFEITNNGIILEFKDGRTYLYDNSKPGTDHVENMKTLALSGRGLTSYVNQNVRDNYKKRLK